MKIRIGFVSNSSTSSFCIIGINLEPESALYDILNIDPEKDYYEHGMYKDRDDGLAVYGDEYGYCCVGLEAEEILKDHTLPEAYQYLRKRFAEDYNIDDDMLALERKQPQLLYGEMGNG